MSIGDRPALLEKAAKKIAAMSNKELEYFLGIHSVTFDEIDPLDFYAAGDTVEITSHISGIGNEFIGSTGRVAGFILDGNGDREFAEVTMFIEDGVMLSSPKYLHLPDYKIKKIKRKPK